MQKCPHIYRLSCGGIPNLYSATVFQCAVMESPLSISDGKIAYLLTSDYSFLRSRFFLTVSVPFNRRVRSSSTSYTGSTPRESAVT